MRSEAGALALVGTYAATVVLRVVPAGLRRAWAERELRGVREAYRARRPWSLRPLLVVPVGFVTTFLVGALVPRFPDDPSGKPGEPVSVRGVWREIEHAANGLDRALPGLGQLAEAIAAIGSATGPGEEKRPGQTARAAGMRAKHPVVIVPGFTTTGLEVWKAGKCAEGVGFKQRLWGNLGMIASVLGMSGECLLEHLSLDQDTGLDPADGVSTCSAASEERD